jgi:prophage DNA circulation protein
MAGEDGIFEGKYKKVQIRISSASLSGGRRKAIKLFPNRDTQSVEDMGMIPRKYALEIILSATQTKDYFGYRKELLAALEDASNGTLVHPLYGVIHDVAVTSYSINESFGEFGFATVSVEFEIDSNTGIPTSSSASGPLITSANKIVQSSLESYIGEGFTLTGKSIKNAVDAIDKVNAIINKVRKEAAFTGVAAEAINEFNALLSGTSDNVNSLVKDPLALADSLNRVFESVGGLFSSASATFGTFERLFGFGESDTDIIPTTTSLIQRIKNRSVLNSYVGASALGYAQLSAIEIEYTTTAEIDNVTKVLERQFVAVMESDADQPSKDALIETRILVTDALQEARLRASAIITVRTTDTTARLLAFDYYGSPELGETINDLNLFENVSFVSGEVEILTQ